MSRYLYNNSPEPVNFVCVLDENAVGQELVVDLTMSTAATLAQKMQPKNPGQLNEDPIYFLGRNSCHARSAALRLVAEFTQ